MNGRPIAVSSAKKILICGASSTGKTTLCKCLLKFGEENGVAVTLVTGTARRCPYKLNWHQTDLASAWLLGEQIRTEVEAMCSAQDVVVCDRGTPDIVAYLKLSGVCTSSLLHATVMQLAMTWARTYDGVYVATLDSEAPMASDEFRNPDKVNQRKTQECIMSALTESGLPYILLPRRTNARVQLVSETLIGILETRGLS